MVPVSCPPCPASITTRDNFKPRLRTSERVPALDALAGTITLASAVLASAGGIAGEVGGVATGLVSAFAFALVSADFLALVAAGGVAGPGLATEAVATGAATGVVAVMGLFAASLPITSMI